ncbi:MAG: SPFH domain-containing protein, partial [Candidatus Diapherotrites archaeon]
LRSELIFFFVLAFFHRFSWLYCVIGVIYKCCCVIINFIMSEASDSTTVRGDSAKPSGIRVLVFILFLVFVVLVIVFSWRYSKFFVDNLLVFIVVALIGFFLIKYDYLIQLMDYERAVIFRFGKLNRVSGPGWALIFPPIESFRKVDLRVKTIDIPAQNVVTKDGIEIAVDGVVYLKVKNDKQSVINSVIQVDDYMRASELFVIGMIRSEAGKLDLNQLISRVDELDFNLKQMLSKLAVNWGVVVEDVVIQDIQVPKRVLEATEEQKAAIQRKLARMEAAEAHKAEIEAVRSAAENLSDKALAYYYVRALEKLGEGQSSKFIFPMELSELAKVISKQRDEKEVEALFKKYAPYFASLVQENQSSSKNSKVKRPKKSK